MQDTTTMTLGRKKPVSIRLGGIVSDPPKRRVRTGNCNPLSDRVALLHEGEGFAIEFPKNGNITVHDRLGHVYDMAKRNGFEVTIYRDSNQPNLVWVKRI